MRTSPRKWEQRERVLRSWLVDSKQGVACCTFRYDDYLLFPKRFEHTGLGAERSIVSSAAAGAAHTGGDSESPPTSPPHTNG